jgi:hypothetical protein
MPGPLHRLVYRSSLAGAERRGDQLEAILAASRRRNAATGLTGALLHDGDAVLQVLEGPLEPLEDTYDRISADLRHTGLVLLQFAPVAERCFPDWRMACLDQQALAEPWSERGAALTPEDIPRMIAALMAALPAPEQPHAA